MKYLCFNNLVHHHYCQQWHVYGCRHMYPSLHVWSKEDTFMELSVIAFHFIKTGFLLFPPHCRLASARTERKFSCQRLHLALHWQDHKHVTKSMVFNENFRERSHVIRGSEPVYQLHHFSGPTANNLNIIMRWVLKLSFNTSTLYFI